VGEDGQTRPVSTVIGRRCNLTYQISLEYCTTNLIYTEPELKQDHPCADPGNFFVRTRVFKQKKKKFYAEVRIFRKLNNHFSSFK